MRSVQAGRDLKQLTDELSQGYGVTRRRAAFIARDQSSKATSALSRVRKLDLGIKHEIWLHSGGGKEPRINHVKFGRERKKFDLEKGMFDPDAYGKGKGAWVQPGFLVGCRCVSRPILSALA